MKIKFFNYAVISVQVLPDGSIKKTNKTVIHNVDGNGQGYIYHSVHHVIHSADDQETKDHVVDNDESTEEEVEPKGEVLDENTGDHDVEDGESTEEDIEPAGEEVPKTGEEPSIDVKDLKSPGEDEDPSSKGVSETAEEPSVDVQDVKSPEDDDQGKDDHDESTEKEVGETDKEEPKIDIV